MVVKIIKCTDPGYWYAGLVGQNFTVEDSTVIDTDKVEKFTVVPTPGTDPLFLINVEDAKIIKERSFKAYVVGNTAILHSPMVID